MKINNKNCTGLNRRIFGLLLNMRSNAESKIQVDFITLKSLRIENIFFDLPLVLFSIFNLYYDFELSLKNHFINILVKLSKNYHVKLKNIDWNWGCVCKKWISKFPNISWFVLRAKIFQFKQNYTWEKLCNCIYFKHNIRIWAIQEPSLANQLYL